MHYGVHYEENEENQSDGNCPRALSKSQGKTQVNP
jgi:hypothetical protein